MHKCNLHQNYKTVSTESGEAILKLILRHRRLQPAKAILGRNSNAEGTVIPAL